MARSLRKRIHPGRGHDLSDSSRRRFPLTIALLEQAVRERVFPGCVFAALSDEELTTGAVGRFTYENESSPVQPETVYDIASLTKVLAATAAAMLLHDRGQLALDLPVAEILPGFAAADDERRRQQVTIGMLLDHSSGLPGYARLYERVADRAGMIDACLREPLTADPGTRAEYSDLGFILMGEMLEEISGERLDAFCLREIFTPLGMRSTRYCPVETLRPSIPPTEDDRNFRHRVIQGEVNDENAWVMGGVSGHAGLFSNAGDPLRLAACLLRGGVTASGDRLVSAQTIALFAKRTEQPPGSSRALGWDTPSTPSSAGNLFSGHSIGHLGFTGTSLWIDLDAGIAVCLLTNRTWPDRANQAIRELRPRFHDALRQELAGDGGA